MQSEWNFKFSDSPIGDLEVLRDIFRDKIDRYMYMKPTMSNIISTMIENDLRRRLQTNQQESTKINLSEKEKLQQERDKFRNQAELIYKWFAYYQDKCKILEKKTGKFVIPDFPDDEKLPNQPSINKQCCCFDGPLDDGKGWCDSCHTKIKNYAK